jgi:DNA replication and repair protein RecF
VTGAPTATPTTVVERLELTGFRSYPSLTVDFPLGTQVVVGPNAAGKTNLLEALVVLGTGRSHRTTTDSELVNWSADFCRLEVALGGGAGDGRTTVEIVIGRTPAISRKRAKVNGVARRPTSLSGTLPVVVFAPEDMLLVVGGPALRRGAVDALVEQLEPAASATYSTYARGLTQRNNLLRAVREGTAERAELAFWDGLVCEEGGRIVEWRRSALAELAGPLARTHDEIAGEGPLSLRYVTNTEPQPTESTQDALRRRLAETADKEVWNGATLVGPHRDDIAFELDGRQMAGAASRGQQRSAILAFKLAQLELLAVLRGSPPLLLLDDVFSELDPQRRAQLVRRLAELPQAFVTTTTVDDLHPTLVAAATVWTVSDGRLERVSGAGR